MATPSNVPMSMTRGASFLPGNLRPKQDVEAMIVAVRHEVDDPSFQKVRSKSKDYWGQRDKRRR